MPSFRWSAINGGGEVIHGVMEAPDRVSVVDRLQRQGQTVLRPIRREAGAASATCCSSKSAASAGSTTTY